MFFACSAMIEAAHQRRATQVRVVTVTEAAAAVGRPICV
jgi:hypothetical protein